MNLTLTSLIVGSLCGMLGQPPSVAALPDPELASEIRTDSESLDVAVELGSCPNVGSCCIGHGGPGCDNTACCETVCNADFFCCLVGWDSDCAGLAQTLCGSLCSGGCPTPGDCCQAHGSGGCEDWLCCDLVCTRTPSCCEAVWSAGCADLAVQVCEACEPPFVCPQPGDCCSGVYRPTPGCEREACCETVCTIDEFCCFGEWDDVCARMARQNCLNVCDCAAFGNFDADPSIDLRDAASFLNCFSGDTSMPVPAACACADYDGDGDADLGDFAVFEARFSLP